VRLAVPNEANTGAEPLEDAGSTGATGATSIALTSDCFVPEVIVSFSRVDLLVMKFESPP
jgi:hypothetical protein